MITIKLRDGARDLIVNDGHGKIATVHLRKTKTDNITDLNKYTRMFAAAPELLAVAQELSGFCLSEAMAEGTALEKVVALKRKARVAVARATGSAPPQGQPRGPLDDQIAALVNDIFNNFATMTRSGTHARIKELIENPESSTQPQATPA